MDNINNVIAQQMECSTSKQVTEETSSINEMKRILNSVDHYEALGFPRQKRIDATILKKEYKKKVHFK